MQQQRIKTLADAEKMIEDTPHLYHIAFIDKCGHFGQTIVGMKEDAPLYKPYFVFNEVNKDEHVLTILSITKLTFDDPIITHVDITEKRKAIVRILRNQAGDLHDDADDIADKIIKEI